MPVTVSRCVWGCALQSHSTTGLAGGNGRIDVGDRVIALDGVPLIDGSGSAVNGGLALKTAFQQQVSEAVTCRTEGHARYLPVLYCVCAVEYSR